MADKSTLGLLAFLRKESGGGGGSGSDNYNDLSNRPKINNVTLSGNKSPSDLGVLAANQGSANAGKVLKVGDDGSVSPQPESGGGGSITVDSAMSSSSTNPVQNKVIYTALGNKLDANQGLANAGSILVVGNDGIIVPVAIATWAGGSY